MKKGETVCEVENVLLKVQLFELIKHDDLKWLLGDGVRQRAGVEGRGRGQLVARSEQHFTLICLYLVLITVYKASAPFVFLRNRSI